MFKFSTAQLQRLVSGSEPMLRLSISNLVREQHAYVVQGLPADLFDRMVGDGLDTARSYGLQAPAQLATFVLLMFELGPEFHRAPVIQRVLTDATIPPDERLAAVLERTPPEAFAAIEAAMDRQTWFPELREPATPR